MIFNLEKSPINIPNPSKMLIHNKKKGLQAFSRVIKLSKTYELSLTRQNRGFQKIHPK